MAAQRSLWNSKYRNCCAQYLRYNIPLLQLQKAASSWDAEEKITHTGQEWDKNDYRLARFIERPKQVNTQWAVKLIEETPPVPKQERVVYCDGGGGPLGHPKVYINLDQPGNHSCGYCGLRFFKEGDHHH